MSGVTIGGGSRRLIDLGVDKAQREALRFAPVASHGGFASPLLAHYTTLRAKTKPVLP